MFVLLPQSRDARVDTLSGPVLPSEAPGQFKIRLLGLHQVVHDWRIVITVGASRSEIDAQTYSAIEEAPGVILVPFSTPGPVVVDRTLGAPGLRFDAIISDRKPIQSLYKTGTIRILSFDIGFGDDPVRRARARAIVKVVFKLRDGRNGSCTGFQFAPGFFITNLHCVKNTKRSNPRTWLIFGATAEYPKGTHTVEAQTIDGIGRLDDVQQIENDYAVLRALSPDEYKDALIRLSSDNSPIANGEPLEAFEFWTFTDVAPAAIAHNADEDCKTLIPPADQRSFCPSTAFMHQCDTETGSSGSAILKRGGSDAIGLHYKGIDSEIANCAIWAQYIITELRAHPIWNEIQQYFDGY
jgi:hypothetical protein